MTSEFPNLDYDQVLGSNFRGQMDQMVVDSVKETAADGVSAVIKGGKSAYNSGRNWMNHHPGVVSGVVLCGLTATSPSTPPPIDQIALRSAIFGGLCGLEEIFEEEHQTPLRKAGSVALKILAGSGFAAIAPNAYNDIKDLYNNFSINGLINSTPTIGLTVSSGAVLAHETDFPAAGRGILNVVKTVGRIGVHKVVGTPEQRQERQEDYIQKSVSQWLRNLNSSSGSTIQSAEQKLADNGFEPVSKGEYIRFLTEGYSNQKPEQKKVIDETLKEFNDKHKQLKPTKMYIRNGILYMLRRDGGLEII